MAFINQNRIIYGISGSLQTGKDTFSKIIGKYNEFYITHFADPIKEHMSFIFDIPLEKFYDNEYKKSVLDNPIEMDDYLEKMCDITEINILPKGKIAKTARQLIQFYGTDYVKNTDNLYWTNKMDKVINQDSFKNTNIILSDLRFLDEVSLVKNNGGRVIKIFRDDLNNKDDHFSENQDIDADLTLKFVTGKTYIQEQVAQALALNKFDVAKQFSYENIKHILDYYS
jgi:hypothetical protein